MTRFARDETFILDWHTRKFVDRSFNHNPSVEWIKQIRKKIVPVYDEWWIAISILSYVRSGTKYLRDKIAFINCDLPATKTNLKKN